MTEEILGKQEGKEYDFIYALILGLAKDANTRISVADRVKEIEEVGLCFATTNPYHFVALIRASRPSEIADINDKINQTPGVHNTLVEIIAADNLTLLNWFKLL